MSTHSTNDINVYLANIISAKIVSFFSNTQNILNIGTVKREPAQVDNFIGTDIDNFPETTKNGIIY